MQEYKAFEVVICENAGTTAADRLRAVLPVTLPGGQKLTVIAADNPGYAGGVNRCLLSAPEADAWWILNPDTVPDRGALAALAARLARGDVDAVGGIVAFSDGRVQGAGGYWNAWTARAKSIGHGMPVASLPTPDGVEQQQNYILGTSMLIGRSWRKRVGLMPESYFLYGEEIAWCLTALRAGLRLGYASDAIVLHEHGTTTGASASVRDRGRVAIELDERNKLNLVRDFHPRRIVLAALAALLIIHWRYGRARAWKQLGYAIRGWCAGLADRRGCPDWLARRDDRQQHQD